MHSLFNSNICEIDKIISNESRLLERLIVAAREGHLCIIGGEEDCEVEVLKGEEEWFKKKVGRWGNRYYLQKNWILENRVVKEFKRLLQTEVDAIDIGNLKGVNVKQHMAVKKGLCEGVLCLTGGPGTGKSYTIGKIIERFQGSVCVCAPTGKAAALLQERLNMKVGTLHRILGVKEGKDLFYGEETLHYDMVIVDECSMIDVGMWSRLLRGVETGTRLILVGDQDQLPPVEAGRVFEELCAYMQTRGRGYVYLDECMRSDRYKILEMAERVKMGELIEYEGLRGGIEKLWKEGYQLLSCLRKGRYGVEEMNRLCEGGNEQPIIITRSNYRMGISNGELGMVQGEKVMIGGRCFRRALIPEYEKSYCLSVHKSQGSEFDKVAFFVPKGSEVFGRAILYTGITRAREEIIVFSEEGVIEACMTSPSDKMSGITVKLQEGVG